MKAMDRRIRRLEALRAYMDDLIDHPPDHDAAARAAILDAAIKRYGEDDPAIRAIIKLYIDVLFGIVHRFADSRLRAADRLLDRLVGRPSKRQDSSANYGDVDRVLDYLLHTEKREPSE